MRRGAAWLLLVAGTWGCSGSAVDDDASGLEAGDAGGSVPDEVEMSRIAPYPVTCSGTCTCDGNDGVGTCP